MAPKTAPTVIEHPNLTTMGLFFEAHAGVVATAGKRLETQHGLSGQPLEVLLRLARTPGKRLRMSDLAVQTTLSASGLTRVVDRLVVSGFVERASCPSDRRGTYAVLTAAGEARLLAALPDHLAHLTELLDAAFTADELAEFSRLIRQLRDVVHPGATSVTPEDSCAS